MFSKLAISLVILQNGDAPQAVVISAIVSGKDYDYDYAPRISGTFFHLSFWLVVRALMGCDWQI
jgi:hypothetical protein